MMLQQQGVPGLIGNSGDSAAAAAAAAAAEAREHGGGGSGGSGGLNNEEEKGRSDESERNSGGSRWPRQETIALLKIRSDMDVAFRDSNLKGPLWDEVSRKLLELGYHRSAKKCKEKFENVYKYHKRTKDGRNTKSDGKTYRFFEQLEALDTHPSLSLMSSSPMKPTILTSSAQLGNSATHISMNTSPVITVSSTPSPISTVFPSNAIHPINLASFNIPPQPTVSISPSMPTNKPTALNIPNLPPSYGNQNMSFMSNSTSSTSSDEQPDQRYGKRKRKWEDLFGKLMNQVIHKQDELLQKFLDTLDKRERDRMAREEAWRAQEMAKLNQEHELLLKERSLAAAKDAAVISFLQKITEQQHNSPNVPITIPPILTQIQAQESRLPNVPPPHPAPVLQAPQPQQPPPPPPIVSTPAPAPTPMKGIRDDVNLESHNYNGSSQSDILMSPSPSRWPKAEIQALIQIRTTLDTKYHENGPKGPLWEEISGAMRKMGYNRNAKRCKEKWENINKYYKKVKEGNKKRPEDAKTCPYFHQLEALYKEKAKTDLITTNNATPFNPNQAFGIKPENQMPSAPIMAQPEQQWPIPQQKQPHKEGDHEHEDENMDDPNLDDDYEDGDEDDDEDDGAGYEIVTNKQQQTPAHE